MSNQRHIRRPVEDAAIGRADRKISPVREGKHRDPITPNCKNLKNEQRKIELTETGEHEKESIPIMENITNPFYNEICHFCDYSRRRVGEWYCHQDEPVVRCYKILNCSAYRLNTEGVITTQ